MWINSGIEFASADEAADFLLKQGFEPCGGSFQRAIGGYSKRDVIYGGFIFASHIPRGGGVLLRFFVEDPEVEEEFD